MSILKKALLILSIIFLLPVICQSALTPNSLTAKGVEDALALKEENLLLEAELELAKRGDTYIILDLSKEKIFLKNRGILLKEFDISKTRYWAEKGLSIESVRLFRKKALFLPARKEIEPLKNEEGVDPAGKMEFLEPDNMPYRYTLSFENGVSISIRNQTEGAVQFIGAIYSIAKHIRHSFMAVWNHLQRKTLTIIDIAMSREDAQALFWSLQEGTSILISGRAST